jgi:hypothetical protein
MCALEGREVGVRDKRERGIKTRHDMTKDDTSRGR